jgi:rSAM/selenodomain-associated transferase 1
MPRLSHDCLLLIAARAPVPGETKTRLGATIGPERAARLYRAFLDDLAARFAGDDPGRSYDVGWAHTPESSPFSPVMQAIRPEMAAVRYVRQRGNGWGERQVQLLRWGSDQGYAKTVLTASDSPQMPRSAIETAFALLDDHEVALGRVHDGGYYLIGVRGFHDVLTGVPMSTARAADAVIERAETLGLRVGLTEPLFDVDVAEDLELLDALLVREPELAPATWTAMRSLGLTARSDPAWHTIGQESGLASD